MNSIDFRKVLSNIHALVAEFSNPAIIIIRTLDDASLTGRKNRLNVSEHNAILNTLRTKFSRPP